MKEEYKDIIISIIGALVITCTMWCFKSCAMGSKPARKLQDKMYRPCQDFEVENPVGKLCNVTYKRIEGKTKKILTVKDFNKREDFLFFRNGSFVFLDEDNL